MLLSAVHHHRTCSAKQMWPTQEVLLKYTSAYTELFRIICIHLQVLLNVILPQQFFVLHVQNFSTQNYLLSTVYQGAYKLGLFYNKEQLFSHVLQFNIFHHKLKFSFNFTIITYPFSQWHLRSSISTSLHCHQKISSMQQNYYPSLVRVD